MSERELFVAALHLTDPVARGGFLDQACGTDRVLRDRVVSLLAEHEKMGSFLDAPAAGSANPSATATFDTDAPPPTADYPGKNEHAGAVIAGKYTLVEPIGEGGMGSVWRAKQTEPVKRFVAVKLIKAGMDSKQVLARFDAERQALAMMDHPNIAKVLDGGLHDHRPYFVMELVKGVPITEYCDALKLTPQQRLELFVQVCQAIQHAHQKGIIHRDIKPSNVLIALYDDKPVVKVIDFGVAKATGGALTEHTIDTGFGGVVGTPQYMSPEQATFNNLDIDTRSDVYALGVLLYELLVGSPPFSSKELNQKGLLEILRVVREEEPPRPSTKLSTADALPTLSANRGTEPKKLTGLLRNELDWIVMKALEKDRARRYETANGFAADVLRYLSGEAVQAHPPSTAYRLRKFVRRNKRQVIAVSLVLTALVGGITSTTAALFQAREARMAEVAARERAETEVATTRAINRFFLDELLAQVDPELNAVGEKLTVRQLLDRAATKIEDPVVFAEYPAVEAAIRLTLGAAYASLGLPASAEGHFRRARVLATARDGPASADALDAGNGVSEALLAQDKLKEAAASATELIALSEAAFGPDHLRTLRAVNTLALSLAYQGEQDRGEELLRRNLDARRRTQGGDARETLEAEMNLAEVLRDLGRLEEAERRFRSLREVYRKLYGPRGVATLQASQYLGSVLHMRFRTKEALEVLEETFAGRRHVLGPDHTDTLQTALNLGFVYIDLDRLNEAETLVRSVLKAFLRVHSADHSDTLTAKDVLAQVLLAKGDAAGAAALYREVVDSRTRLLQPDHAETLLALNGLACAQERLGQWPEAERLFRTALEARQRVSGATNPETLLLLGNLGRLLVSSGQPEAALPFLREAIAGRRGSTDSSPDVLANVLTQQGRALLLLARPADAEPILREALTIHARELPDAWTTFNSQSLLGGALLGQKKYADAEPLLLKCYEGMKQREKAIPSQGATRIPEALDRLIELYTATNKPDEATKWQAERADYTEEVAPMPRRK